MDIINSFTTNFQPLYSAVKHTFYSHAKFEINQCIDYIKSVDKIETNLEDLETLFVVYRIIGIILDLVDNCINIHNKDYGETVLEEVKENHIKLQTFIKEHCTDLNEHNTKVNEELVVYYKNQCEDNPDNFLELSKKIYKFNYLWPLYKSVYYTNTPNDTITEIYQEYKVKRNPYPMILGRYVVF